MNKPKYHEKTYQTDLAILKSATKKLTKFLKVKSDTPKLILRYDQGPTAQTKIIDGVKKGIILRPEKSQKRYGKLKHPPEIIIHELTHILEDKFLDLPPDTKRKTDTATYLSNGLANFLATEDVADIYKELDMTPRENFETRIKQKIKTNPKVGSHLINFIDLNKLYSVKQPDLEKEHLTPKLTAKKLIPYWIGPTLIKFIYQQKGIQAIKKIMQQVQVNKKYAYGWETSLPPKGELKNEEKKVRKKLKKAISKEFGDIKKFESNWKEFVLK